MAKAKEIEGLDCEAEAGRGMRLVLLARLEEMCEFRSAALDWTSDEGVHDMRVASRRLRSALRDFRPHLRGGRQFDAARAELKRLADALGAVRDEDVAISALEKLEEESGEQVGKGLELYAGARIARREKARAELARTLEEESFESARSRIKSALEKATEARKKKRGDVEGGTGEANKVGLQTFRDLGRSIIERSWDELSERGPSLYSPLKAGRLHKVRIAAKRLRYALELFTVCFGEEAKQLAHELSDLQTALGDLHDCDEWVKKFGEHLSEHQRKSSEEAAGVRREAAFWMLEHFSRERAKHYGAALALWRAMETEDFASRLRRCVCTLTY